MGLALGAEASQLHCQGTLQHVIGKAGALTVYVDWQVDSANPANDPRCHAIPHDQLQTTLGLQQSPNSESWVAIDAVVLVGWLIFYRTLVYICLRYKTARR